MNRQRGYVLWLTVLVVALLAIAALTLASAHDASRPRVEAAGIQARAAVVAETVTARVAFLMLTEPMGPRSVVIGAPREAGMASAGGGPELRLDGRLYNIGERTWVGVQDEAGLISVNAGDEVPIAALLRDVGLGSVRARGLAAALADFVDADTLVRAGGAEAAGSDDPAPVGRSLPTRWAILDAPGWRAELEQRNTAERLFNALTTQDGERGVNVNTAPRLVLEALFGARLAAEVVERREQREIRDASELQSLTDASAAAGAGLAVAPGDTFRVTVLVSDESGRSLFFERRLTLAADGVRPVYWEEERRGNGDAGYSEAHEQPVEPYPQARARFTR